jgi:hemoglobin
MTRIRSYVAIGCITLGTLTSFAADEVKSGDKCPITGKPANPKCSLEYEGKTYTFCSGDCRTKFNKDRINSLYHQIGGRAAISAAVDLFYTKVLADKRVNHFFEDVNMKRQHNKQKAFLSAALGGPEPWTGKDLRKAHASLDLNEAHFNAIAGHLRATLEELKVTPDLIGQVMALVANTKDEVLNRKKDSK